MQREPLGCTHALDRIVHTSTTSTVDRNISRWRGQLLTPSRKQPEQNKSNLCSYLQLGPHRKDVPESVLQLLHLVLSFLVSRVCAFCTWETLMSLKHERAMRAGRLVMLPQILTKALLRRGMKKRGPLGPGQWAYTYDAASSRV